VAAAQGLADRRPPPAHACGRSGPRRPARLHAEVKARATGTDLDLAIDERRLSRVAAAAEMLFYDLAKPGDDMRIDVILLAPGRPPRHLANV
jgi:putative endonuclease